MNEGGWYNCDKIRFRFGVPEKINGWQRYSDTQFLGICRRLHNWIALDQSNYVALGTHLKLYIEEGTQYYDITPFRAAEATLSTDALKTGASGSKEITVTHVSHGAVTNDFVTISGAATFDGITADQLNTEHQVTVVDGNTYTITVASDTATSGNTAGGGSSIKARFQINTGLDTIVSGTGWGAGQWGGTTAADPATTLNGAINLGTDGTASGIATTLDGALTTSNGTGGSGTSITLTDASGFPTAGSIVVDDKEIITYTGKSSNNLTGITRGTGGTTAVAHADDVAVKASVVGTLNGALLADTNGTGGSGTSITLTDATAFPSSGSITVGSEIITYTGKSGNDLTTITRAANSTSSAAHSDGASVRGSSIVLTDATSFPSSGSIVVNEIEVIAYTGKTSNTLTGITRAQDGTLAVSHANGVAVRGAAAITGWGDAASLAATSGTEARIWSLDNFGEDLLSCVRDGELFYWDKTDGLSTRSVKLVDRSGASQVPLMARQIMVSDRSRHCIAFATNAQTETAQDPLLIRFSKAENAVNWDITATGTDAGDLLIGSGSQFITALETKREILVWTDVSLHSMQFIGAPNTFGLVQIASGLSIIGPNAVTAVNDQVFWMGENQFYLYDGRTQQIPCTVRDYVFDDINNDQRELVTAGLNSAYYEVFWFYPSKNSTEVDKYVVFNYSEQVWYFGTLARTAWIDAEIRSYPVAASPDRYLYNHELGNDDGSTSPATAIQAFIESSPLSIEGGDQFQLIRRVVPDITFDGSEQATPTVKFTLQGYDRPGQAGQGSVNGTVTKEASETVEKYTDELFLRLRGRAFSVKVENTGTGTQWRLGIPRVDLRPDGRR
tara:strand:+ start:6327 stop:8861 length:2535 start_codon:yes stop_codon:yes gene_type:complete